MKDLTEDLKNLKEMRLFNLLTAVPHSQPDRIGFTVPRRVGRIKRKEI